MEMMFGLGKDGSSRRNGSIPFFVDICSGLYVLEQERERVFRFLLRVVPQSKRRTA